MTVTRANNPPISAQPGDQWVDQSDLDRIYVCQETYDSTTLERTLSLDGQEITFKTVAPHAPSRIVILNDGGNGVARSGDGTPASPFIYTLHTGEDLVSILASMPTLTVEGADASSGALLPLSDTDMVDTIKDDYWAVRAIFARFVAVPPQMNVSDGELPGYIPPAIRMVLPEATALRLAAMDGGGDLNRAQLWNNRIIAAMRRAKASSKAVKTTKQSRRYF